MSQPPDGPKIIRPDSEAELEKLRLAAERRRQVLRQSKGTAANVLAQSGAFGKGGGARASATGSDLLG